jgi:hypothetical protein
VRSVCGDHRSLAGAAGGGAERVEGTDAMSDESHPFRLLTGHLLNHLHLARPAARGCAACRRPWRQHPRDQRARRGLPCERCGLWMAPSCYEHLVAVGPEREWWESDEADNPPPLICPGCRQ